MRIPQQIHQFTREHAFIVVAGKQDALFYEARDGEINLVDSLKISRPQYSDNEGHFKARSQSSGVIRSGSVREVKDQQIISEFIRELKEHLSKVRSEKYTDVYLTAPAKTKNEIMRAMSSGFKEKIRSVVDGNYSHTNPLGVVDTLMATRPRAPKPQSQEAADILNRPLNKKH